MQIKRVSIFCITLLILCIAFGCTSDLKEPGRYYNKSKGFSIRFPDGWKKQNPDMGITVKVSNPENTASIGVQVQQISPQQTLVDCINHMKSLVQTRGGRIIQDGQTIIDSHDAYWFIGTMGREQILYYCIKKENSIFAIIFTSSEDVFTDDLENNMREVANSFRFE